MSKQRHVVNLHAVVQVPYSCSLTSVETSHDYDLVASLHEAVAQLKHMHFHSTQAWEEEVTQQQDVVLSLFPV